MQTPDPEKSQRFLVEFGFLPAGDDKGYRYFRSTDPAPYCYILEEGPPRFLGFAFNARAMDDLHSIASRFSVEVEEIPAPGGGHRVRIADPNGYDVDIVFGIREAEAIVHPRQPFNTGSQPHLRVGEPFRTASGATPLKRLAHVVMATPLIEETARWYRENLGLLSSDNLVAGPMQMLVGTFLRINAGQEYVDHHAMFLIRSERTGLQHLSFEAQDIEAVLSDHHHLKRQGYTHSWGIGRHQLGSQIFDYWLDPNGYVHEHFSDSDRLDASIPTSVWDVKTARPAWWGDNPPESFIHQILP
jgi:catechol 2,3-dioxygenase-like lactoylglutathione lyase family enzyme